MNFSKKLILAGLAVSLLALPACEKHGRSPGPPAGGGGHGITGGHTPGCGQPGGPGPGNHYGQQNRVFDVYIYTDPDDSTKCDADQDVATLWTKTKKNGQTVSQSVCWISDDSKEYTVLFNGKNGSPFEQSTFDVTSETPSGPLLKGSNYYDFSIYMGKDTSTKPCKDLSDPGYYVKP